MLFITCMRATFAMALLLSASCLAGAQELKVQAAAAATVQWTEWTVAGGIPLSLLILAIAAITLLRNGRSSELIAGPPAESTDWRKTAQESMQVLMKGLAV